MKKLIKFYDNFRDKENKHLGWMFIPQNIWNGDKQIHTLRGGWVGVSYFIMNNAFGISNGLSIFYSFLLVISVSYFFEFINKNKPGRVFSHHDVVAECVGWFLMVIVGGQIIASL
tara:strand:- start:582 stop:926 length:345 start_codon:yes stop_codon:yes gene_type:complete